jgi:phosphoadenosine phosphosulfate reductase
VSGAVDGSRARGVPVGAPRARSRRRYGASELAVLAEAFEHVPAEAVVRWAVGTFGERLCVTSSLADAVLVDLALSVDPGLEVVFIDTGYHFPETLETLDRVRRRYGAEVRVVRAAEPPDDRWRTDPDGCCEARKVAPLAAALAGRDAWMTGVRRADSATRASTPVVALDPRGLVKVAPLATWADADVDAYVAAHDVPVNPLVGRGYPSVGCRPCTSTVAPGGDRRSGRWAGTAKSECGLHL